ncbi:trypsin-1-like [Rhipicephalus sanguineus]|uniref:trypsin-1-like n=1 Tax=Rhipicephalus sanguineus TaxID=34632 RepID=UPI001895F160|nr:trypsin-1-like [Rhipicephalus sanguineus]
MLRWVICDVINTKDCGLFTPSGRIVGGDLVQKKDQVPWAVQLSLPYIYNATHNSSKSCGGSIISAHFVLTASHCISLEGINLHESKVFYNSTEKHGGPTVGIAALIRYPLFIPGAFAHDIALAKTIEPISFDRFVRPVCLPRKRSKLDGKKAVVSGWGRVSADSKISSGLVQATQTILPFKRCGKSLSEVDPHRALTWRVALCAREKGKGICMGDSGGPLTIITEGHKAVQVGVVSFAFGCAHQTNADFYTRVSTYVPWIREQLAAPDK